MDRDRVINAFTKYTKTFDATNHQIKNKINHTMHVAYNSEFVASKLIDSNTGIDLAWLIGILHDIGRFEQVKRTQGYTDTTSLDHAQFGVDLLFKSGMINEFIDSEHDFEIIRKSILYHNKLDLPAELTPHERTYCNIIRDADKTDNFRGFHENDFLSFHERTVEEVQESEISEAVIKCFIEHRTIPHRCIVTAADFFLLPYALYFGLVYDCTRELVEEQGYYDRMLDFEFTKTENQEKFEKIKKEILLYKNQVRQKGNM